MPAGGIGWAPGGASGLYSGYQIQNMRKAVQVDQQAVANLRLAVRGCDRRRQLDLAAFEG